MKIQPFPGELIRQQVNKTFVSKTGSEVNRNVSAFLLTDEQKEWLARWFPIIENNRLAKAMGISHYKLHCFARELGLVKSEEGLKAIKRRQARAMARTNERNGCYERKRGHPPSEATLEGNRKRWQEVREGKREKPQEIAKRTNPKKWKASIEKRSESRRKLIEKEKLRMVYGLERKTNLKVVVLKPYTRSQLHHRYNAMQRGYLLDVDCSEGTPGRYVIYYDDQTKRSEKFEANCIKDGFKIKEA